MRTIIGATLFAALGFAYAGDETYSFRDATLGMTLAEAKAMKWPDKVYESAGEPVFTCHGDEGAGAGGTYEANRGVTQCSWRTPPDKKWHRYSWSTPMIQVGEGMAQHVVYLFMPREGEADPRLFSIDIRMKNVSYPLLLKGLKEKFGKPSKVDKGMAQNLMGATFSDDYTVWRNKTSLIALSERTSRYDEMHLVYQLSELQAVYEKMRAEAGGSKL